MWVSFLIYNYCLWPSVLCIIQTHLSRIGTFTGTLSTSHVLQIWLRSARSFVHSKKLRSKRTGSSRKLSFRKKNTDGGRETEVIHTGTCDHTWKGVEFSHKPLQYLMFHCSNHIWCYRTSDTFHAMMFEPHFCKVWWVWNQVQKSEVEEQSPGCKLLNPLGSRRSHKSSWQPQTA